MWIPWVEFALLGMLLVISAVQPRAIISGIVEVVNPIQRRYTDGSERGSVYLIQGIFQLGTTALVLMTAVRAYGAAEMVYTLSQYSLVLLLCLMVGGVKTLIDCWIQYIFQYAVHLPTFLIHRGKLWQTVSIVLLAYLLCTPHWSNTACWIVPLCVAVCYWGLMAWKLLSVFGLSLEHILNIVIYILHNEVLPVVILVAGTGRILSI